MTMSFFLKEDMVIGAKRNPARPIPAAAMMLDVYKRQVYDDVLQELK